MVTSSNLGLWANGTSSIKQEVHNVSLRRQKKTEPRLQATCKKFGEDRACSSKDMIAERQTDRHGHQNTLFPYRGGVIIARSNLFIGHSMVFLEESLELPWMRLLYSLQNLNVSQSRFTDWRLVLCANINISLLTVSLVAHLWKFSILDHNRLLLYA